MLKVKLTSKRQATFPRAVCESMGVKPGDDLNLERRVEGESEVWVISPAVETERSWFGQLRDYARGKNHDMGSIRNSIARGREAENE